MSKEKKIHLGTVDGLEFYAVESMTANDIEFRRVRSCKWTWNISLMEDKSLSTECGNTVMHTDGFIFCPFCGGRIEAQE